MLLDPDEPGWGTVGKYSGIEAMNEGITRECAACVEGVDLPEQLQEIL